MRTPALRPLAAVLALGALALPGCGGGNDKDATGLLDRAFSTQIPSANIALDAQLELKGSTSLPFLKLQANGPFRNNHGKLPSIDVDVDLGTGGAQTIHFGILSTGDRAFLKFQDVFYEQPRSLVQQANVALSRRAGRGGPLGRLGLHPRAWLKDAKEEGTDEIAGVQTTHVSGELNVERAVRDMNQFVKSSRGTLRGATAGAAPPPLSDTDIKKIAKAVKDPHFDVYVGKSDNIIRRVSGRLEVDIPKEDQARVGIDKGALSFSFELSKVGGDQRIVAPAKARPISDLASLFAGGALGSAGGAGGSQSQPLQSIAPDPQARKRYTKCIDKANPRDRNALLRCADLLR